ncbi:MAG: PEP-CTERM sorting domain-containing protein [Planctomycetaceae bacterium]|nr:PEP-CTERM sorting domain-containing protein [Planctomycetaceae bacterium]
MRLQKAKFLLAPCLLLICAMQVKAGVQYEIGDVDVTSTGASFVVFATPDMSLDIFKYETSLQFTNFQNLTSFEYAFDTSVLDTNTLEVPSETTPNPANIVSGNQVTFSAINLPGLNAVGGVATNLIKVDIDVAGGFALGSSFDVSFSSPNTYDPTSISGPGVAAGTQSGATTIAAVPEPSAFLLIGLVGMIAGGVNWFRRRNTAE